MEGQNEKLKLTVEEQIQNIVDKNIQFDLYSKEDAKKFLKYNNYYFKLKSYAKNYNINQQTKKYYNLDFAYLVELSKLDMYIRKIILELYELYYQTYPSFNYSDYLKSIKFIRNAAAHNNCILSTLRKPNSLKKFSKTKKWSNILGKIPEFRKPDSRNAMMEVSTPNASMVCSTLQTLGSAVLRSTPASTSLIVKN